MKKFFQNYWGAFPISIVVLLVVTATYADHKADIKIRKNIPFIQSTFEYKMGIDNSRAACYTKNDGIYCSTILKDKPAKYHCYIQCEWLE